MTGRVQPVTSLGGPGLWRRAVIAAGAASILGACARVGPPPVTTVSPAQQWTDELALTRRAATDGRFDAADSMLASYATRHPGTVEALETDYWRAMLKMDPANPHPSLISAMALLDGYLADVRPHDHAAEAATLRRLAAQLDVLNKTIASGAAAPGRVAVADPGGAAAKPAAPPAAAPVDQSASDELKRLRDELAKANAELERIRKRLGTPPPPPRR